MKRPDSMEGSLAIALTMMGAAFAVAGVADLRLLLCGGAFLAGGVFLLVRERRQKKAEDQLRTAGRRVPARVVSVKHHTTANLSLSRSAGRGARRSPWTVYCEYTWEGQTYAAHTRYLYRKPMEGITEVAVFLDPANPGKGVVDLDSIRFDW